MFVAINNSLAILDLAAAHIAARDLSKMTSSADACDGNTGRFTYRSTFLSHEIITTPLLQQPIREHTLTRDPPLTVPSGHPKPTTIVSRLHNAPREIINSFCSAKQTAAENKLRYIKGKTKMLGKLSRDIIIL